MNQSEVLAKDIHSMALQGIPKRWQAYIQRTLYKTLCNTFKTSDKHELNALVLTSSMLRSAVSLLNISKHITAHNIIKRNKSEQPLQSEGTITRPVGGYRIESPIGKKKAN